MTYNEWRDELKSNLLSVSESERRRVLDYYAEAYADRREAGFSEREIMDEFGAPYDAAQRILYENKNNDYYDNYNPEPEERSRRERRREEREQRRQAENTPPPPPPNYANNQQNYNNPPYPNGAPAYTDGARPAVRDNTWVFVLLCIIFFWPIFGVVISMVVITVLFCVAPIAAIGTGAAMAGSAIGTMVGGNVAYGLMMTGVGVIIIGVGVILCPLFFKLVGLMWTAFRNFFAWLRSLFSGRRHV